MITTATILAAFGVAVLECATAFTITVFQPQMTTLTPSKADQLAALATAAASASAASSNLLIVPGREQQRLSNFKPLI